MSCDLITHTNTMIILSVLKHILKVYQSLILVKLIIIFFDENKIQDSDNACLILYRIPVIGRNAL
jgi:hypothetical protein